MKYKWYVKYLDGVPRFYGQLVHFWHELRSRPSHGAEEILDEYLWYSRSLLIDDKPIFLKSWSDNCIKRISDVMKLNGSFHSKEKLSNNFGIHLNIMKYNSLISAIPYTWKQCRKNSTLSCIYFTSRWYDQCKAL